LVSFRVRFPNAVLLRFAEALVGGLELPDFEFLDGRRGTDGEGVDGWMMLGICFFT
jgi:hypothetical protein